MPAPYPKDLRERVIEAHLKDGGTYEELAERFMVGRATVNRWLRRYRTTGKVDAKPTGGARHEFKVDEQGLAMVAEALEVMPDTTLVELTEAYVETFGVRMHPRTMGRAVARLGHTKKRGH